MFCAFSKRPEEYLWEGDAAYTSYAIGGRSLRLHAGDCGAAACISWAISANTDPKDPRLLPINSPEVLAKFPPTLIITGYFERFEMSFCEVHLKPNS